MIMAFDGEDEHFLVTMEQVCIREEVKKMYLWELHYSVGQDEAIVAAADLASFPSLSTKSSYHPLCRTEP